MPPENRQFTSTELDPHFGGECVQLFSEFLHALGLPKSVGSIYGLLFASARPLCFSEIVDALGASKGSVSAGLAVLRQCGAVKLVTISGDRREFFEPELGLRRLASGLIREKLDPIARDARDSLLRMKQRAGRAVGPARDFQLDRIAQLEIWHRQLGRIMPLVRALVSVVRK